MLSTKSIARSSTIRNGGIHPVWEADAKGSVFRLSFDGIAAGDRLLLCLAVFDQDVVRDDEIGFGSVDVTAIGYQDAGTPGQQVTS